MARIHELVDEEHQLRARFSAGELSAEEEQERLRTVEESLDRCWDLLRRRRAARAAGTDPETMHARDTAQVRSYLQ